VILSVICVSAFQKVPSCSERQQVVIERPRASRSEKGLKVANSKRESGAVGPKACRRRAMTHVFVWQASCLAETGEHVRACSDRWLCRVRTFAGARHLTVRHGLLRPTDASAIAAPASASSASADKERNNDMSLTYSKWKKSRHSDPGGEPPGQGQHRHSSAIKGSAKTPLISVVVQASWLAETGEHVRTCSDRWLCRARTGRRASLNGASRSVTPAHA